MAHWNEDSPVEQLAIQIFEAMGYEYLNCYQEIFRAGGTLGRETSNDVIKSAYGN